MVKKSKTQGQKTSAPTLTTILMVEEALSVKAKSPLTVAQLKKILPKQVNHNVLMVILKYLESSKKIAVSLEGISWIHSEGSQK